MRCSLAAKLTRPLAGLPDWRYRLGSLVTDYKVPKAAGALELFAAVGRLAKEKNHHPAWTGATTDQVMGAPRMP